VQNSERTGFAEDLWQLVRGFLSPPELRCFIFAHGN
jgi:hypothetical protein